MIRLLATSAVALIAGAAPVLAELTPAQVWDSLESYYTAMGSKVEVGQRDESGDTLTVSDITLSPPAADTASTTTITVPKMILQQTGDAKVRTMIEGDTLIDSITTPPEGEPVEFDATVSLPDNEMISSGTPDAMTHEVVYPQIKVAATFTGGAAQDGKAPLTILLNDVKGRQQNQDGTAGRITYDLSAAGVDIALSAKEPVQQDGSGGTGQIDASGNVTDLTASGWMQMPSDAPSEPQALNSALASGMALDGTLTMGRVSGEFVFSGQDEDGQPQDGKASYAAGPSSMAFSMSKDGLGYEGSGKNSAVEMTLGSLPFPITYAVAETSAKMMLPVTASDQPQPFTLAYSLSGLTMGDAIWGLFDPQAKLPRDPASLTVDLSGNALVGRDLLDPALAEKMQREQDPAASGDLAAGNPADQPAGPDMPFAPQDLTINRIALDAVGAKADLTGQLAFGDTPNEPVGKIQGSFTGLNTLLETLSAMGLLPQEQLMATRMMLAMFARPSDSDPETMTTEIEFREGGSIFANGQQVK